MVRWSRSEGQLSRKRLIWLLPQLLTECQIVIHGILKSLLCSRNSLCFVTTSRISNTILLFECAKGASPPLDARSATSREGRLGGRGGYIAAHLFSKLV
jgi:hypothetical protein